MIKSTNWKHANANELITCLDAERVDVFDDERKGYVSLYYATGDKRSPIRDIEIAAYDPDELNKILKAWGFQRPLNDLRTNATSPLPA